MAHAWAVVVVKWSAFLPSTPTIRVRIPLKSTVFSVILCLKRTKINKKRPGLAHFKKIEAVNGPLKIFFSAAPLKMHQN